MRNYCCFYLAIFVLSILTGCSRQDNTIYDVAIVGGGLAGLSAAYELKDQNVIVIEKNDRLGGRIWTKYWKDIPYELGALFGYSANMLSSGISKQPVIEEPDPIGFSLSGKTYLGKNVAEAFSQFTEDQTIVSEIKKTSVRQLGSLSLNDFPQDTRQILNAFFNLIHPGETSEYLPERLNDAFVRFNTKHYSGGNGELVAAISSQANPKIMTSAEVISVIDKGSIVQVIIKSENKEKTIQAKKVIVATPATVAKKIIKNIKPDSQEFLSAVKYGEGMVVVFGVNKPNIIPFSYVVTTDRSFNSLFQSRIKGDIRIFTVYYVSNQVKKLAGKNIDEIISLTKTEINSMGIGNIKDSEILFSDGYKWNDIGTIISAKAYLGFNPEWLQTSKNVFLAGDYTLWNRQMLPYGMSAASESGRYTAKTVKKQLDQNK